MRQSIVVYPNLRAEMSRKELGIVEMAERLNCNRDTLARKLSKKTQINLDDAFNIQRTFFPDMEITYLFADDAIPGGAVLSEGTSAS